MTQQHNPEPEQNFKKQAYQAPDSNRIAVRMPMTPPTVKLMKNKETDPERFLGSLIPYVAHTILNEWREQKQLAGSPRAREKTIERYTKTVMILEHKYANENNITTSELNPIETVRKFFSHGANIGVGCYRIYRYSLLYILNERELDFRNKGLPQTSLVMALAALIIFSSPPYGPLSKAEDEPVLVRKRAKTIRGQDLTDLITHMAIGYSSRNKIARKAHSAVIATLATGMRPGEWLKAELRDAFPEEMPDGQSPAGWLAVVVNTSKRKEGEDTWMRTLLIEPGINQTHIRQHYRLLMESVAGRLHADEPDGYYNTRCSNAISQACRDLWPTKPERWITWYSLRSQARANFVAVHGAYVAAGMMGHAPVKAQRFYAGPSWSNLARGGTKRQVGGVVPLPGPDCLAKAEEFRRRETDARAEAVAILTPAAAADQASA